MALPDTHQTKLSTCTDLYVGLEPYRNNNNASLAGGIFGTTAPAVFGLLSAIELHPDNPQCGVFAPEGGFRCVSAAMEKLCLDLGVAIRCNQTVLSVSNSGVWVRGIDNDDGGSFLAADLVVVNADLPYAQKSLVTNGANDPMQQQRQLQRYDWEDKYRFSSGVIAFHWATNVSLDALNTHNVFLQAGSQATARKSWSPLRCEEAMSGPSNFSSPDQACNFYVHRPINLDPTAAPPVRKQMISDHLSSPNHFRFLSYLDVFLGLRFYYSSLSMLYFETARMVCYQGSIVCAGGICGSV